MALRLDRYLLDDVVIVGFRPGDAAGHEVEDVAIAYALTSERRGTGEPGPVRSAQRPSARWSASRPSIGTDLASAAQHLWQHFREWHLVRQGQVKSAPRGADRDAGEATGLYGHHRHLPRSESGPLTLPPAVHLSGAAVTS